MDSVEQLQYAASSTEATKANAKTFHELRQQQYLHVCENIDHDDLYMLSFAYHKNGFIISNDLYRDHISEGFDQAWVIQRRIGFMWIGEEFVPNPQGLIQLESFMASQTEASGTGREVESPAVEPQHNQTVVGSMEVDMKPTPTVVQAIAQFPLQSDHPSHGRNLSNDTPEIYQQQRYIKTTVAKPDVLLLDTLSKKKWEISGLYWTLVSASEG